MKHARALLSGFVLLLLLVACSGPTGKQPTLDPLAPAAAPGSAEPHLATTPDGRALLSWLEPRGEEVALRYSVLGQAGWTEPVDIATGTDWFVNWADFPSVVPVSSDVWAAHWLRKTPGSPYAYDISVSISRDGGARWQEPFTLHDDGTASEHGFVSLFPWRGDIGAVWLDGRETLAGDPLDAQMTLRAARLSARGRKLAESVVDGRVCDCCQTDVAVAAGGPVAVYRDRSADEIRDIYVARFRGDGWTEGVPVATDGWEIAGCPVNGPAIVARHDRVAVAWFTAAQNRTRVRLAFSADGGASFAEPFDIDTERPLGRVSVAALEEDSVLVTWMRNIGEQRADILARRYGSDGSAGPLVVVATTSAARRSGFPQAVLAADDTVVFAWTDVSGDETALRSATAPTSLFFEL